MAVSVEINPNLTRNGEGYVYWKGQQVEHYDYSFDRMGDAPASLVKRCEFLESLDIAPSTRTAVWFWESLQGLTVEHPFYAFIKLTKELHERDGNELAWFTAYEPEPAEYPFVRKGTLRIWNGETVRDETVLSDVMGGFYHPMQALGFRTANAGQPENCGFCYATTEGITALLERHGWTRATATEVL